MALITQAELDAILEKAKSAPLPTRRANSAPWCMQIMAFAFGLLWLILGTVSEFDKTLIFFGLMWLAVAGYSHSNWEQQKLICALQQLIADRSVGGERDK